MFFPITYATNFSPFIHNRTIVEEKYIFFTGKPTPEQIQITKLSFNHYVLTINTVVNQQWKTIFQKNYDGAIEHLATGHLLRDRRQQIVIGRYSLGSSGTLHFEVFGWSNEAVKVLLSKFGPNDGYPFGKIHINNNVLYVTALTQGEIFIWDGKQFVSYPYLNNPNPVLISNNDVVIYYEIFKDGKITSSIPVNSQLTLKKGQRIFLIRGNFGPVERVLLTGDIFSFDFNIHPQILTTSKPGQGTFTIIPNLYDWQNAIEYRVEVFP